MEARINIKNEQAEELIQITGQKNFEDAVYDAIEFTLLHEADNVRGAPK